MRFAFLVFANVFIFNGLAVGQHFYYTPNTVAIPVLVQKQDFGVSAGTAWGNGYDALELQGVYSPISHGAIMLNGFMSRSNEVRSNRKEGAGYRFFELGIGAYHALERGSASIFAGVGQGNLYNYYGNDNFSDFRVRRYFVQPGLAYEDAYFRCGLALRFSRLSYPKGQSSFDIDAQELDAIRKIEEDSPFFLPELGLNGGIVLSPFVLAVNLSTVFPDVPGLNFSRFNMSLMLTFELGKVERKQK